MLTGGKVLFTCKMGKSAHPKAFREGIKVLEGKEGASDAVGPSRPFLKALLTMLRFNQIVIQYSHTHIGIDSAQNP